MTLRWATGVVVLAVILAACRTTFGPAGPAASPGWGIDALLTEVGAPAERAAYVALLQRAGIGIVRERAPVPAMAELHAAGLQVDAFAALPGLAVEQGGDSLPENLLAVYAAARALEQAHGADVDSWEMVGEPDVGFCRDLPDRVAAFQKAVYLGLKAGASRRGAPVVLMGALALPPGPWLERATANGLLDYTDAYNLHFYGFARDFASVVTAHRAFQAACASERLPIWVTECGFDAGPPEAIRDAAAQAWEEPAVAVFMPFVLRRPGDPYALTEAPDRVTPAWRSLAAFTAAHPFPARPRSAAPGDPNPVVLQWMPDNRTAIPHKVSGTYRFWQHEPMRGALRIYNLGAKPVRGSVRVTGAGLVASATGDLTERTIRPLSRFDVPLVLTPPPVGYFREEWSARFREVSGRESRVEFGLEAMASQEDLRRTPLAWLPVLDLPEHGDLDGSAVSSRSESWLGLNGLGVAGHGGSVELWSTGAAPQLSAPTVAIARIAGLPAAGFLHLKLDRAMDADFHLRVDLVDASGQRFTVWENFGADYFGRQDDLWLSLADFNVYFWGRCSVHPRLRPEVVQQVRLRCYFAHPGVRRQVTLDFVPAAPAISARPPSI